MMAEKVIDSQDELDFKGRKIPMGIN